MDIFFFFFRLKQKLYQIYNYFEGTIFVNYSNSVLIGEKRPVSGWILKKKNRPYGVAPFIFIHKKGP